MEHEAIDRWLEPARRGDKAARARLLDGLQDRWYRFALSLLGSREQAEEAVQETAVRFLERLSGFRADSSVSTWSLGIVLNVVREHRRKKTPLGTEEPEKIAPAEQTPDRLAQRGETKSELLKRLTNLPVRQREVIVLRFLEGLSVEETADLLGCAPGTVKASAFQGLRTMRDKMARVLAS